MDYVLATKCKVLLLDDGVVRNLTWIVQNTGQIQAEAASTENPTPTLPPIISVSYVPNDNVPWPTTLPGTAM